MLNRVPGEVGIWDIPVYNHGTSGPALCSDVLTPSERLDSESVPRSFECCFRSHDAPDYFGSGSRVGYIII